jgi:hypothetical protein
MAATITNRGRSPLSGHHVPTRRDCATRMPYTLARSQVVVRIVFDSWRVISLRMQTAVADNKPRLYFAGAGLAEEIATREGHRDSVSAM